MAGAGFGQLNQQRVQQFDHRFVDVLRAVVGMKCANKKRELLEEVLQDRNQIAFANFFHGTHDFELRHFINRIEMIDAFHPIEVALMDGIHAQIPRLPIGLGLPALADDSGLSIDALNGAPGIYSARWAGPSKDFAVAMARIEREMAGKEVRRARFVCALSLAWPDGHGETFEGNVPGVLRFPPSGAKGFGYDPIFVPDGHSITFAEMEPQAKHAISHRADAFRQLVAACFT